MWSLRNLGERYKFEKYPYTRVYAYLNIFECVYHETDFLMNTKEMGKERH